MEKPVFWLMKQRHINIIQHRVKCMSVKPLTALLDYGSFEFKFELKLELHNIFSHRDHDLKISSLKLFLIC